MRSFLTANDRAFKTVQILNGPTTRAVIQPASKRPIINDQFPSPKQILMVRPGSLIRASQVIVQGGRHYLTGELADSSDWQSFYLFACDRQVSWTRAVTVTDPTTGLSKSNGGPPTSLGTPWVYWERPLKAPYDSETRIPLVDYVVVTNENVQAKDLVDGKTIVRRDRALGLLVLGLKE